MTYDRVKCELYIAEGKSWEEMARDLLASATLKQGIIRLIFFTSCTDNEEYLVRRKYLKRLMETYVESPRPLISLIVQKPLVGELVLESHSLSTVGKGVIVKEIPTTFGHYLRIESKDYREIVVGGLCGEDLNASVCQQSQQAFEKARQILEAENMDWEDIVRQWNYLERITEFSHDNQRYQDFNDIRSSFYSLSQWQRGYPAATGIGTQYGGVQIDFNAVKGAINILPLDNDWQKAAHVYSDEVLISGGKEKETPKFERGKLVSDQEQGLVYISGTAAIRGEDSIEGSILAQTRITMENIQHLIEIKEVNNGTSAYSGKIEFLRVYLKDEEDVLSAKEEMDKLCPAIPTAYLWADVCREELLIEIEGIAGL